PRRRKRPSAARSSTTRRSSARLRSRSSPGSGTGWQPPRPSWHGSAGSSTPYRRCGGASQRVAAAEPGVVGPRANPLVFDLGRIEGLLELLGDPQKAYPSIHVTGTNGKTSTARMIDALLRAHGLRTGRYTSPHLQTVRERITIESEPVSEERFADAYDEVAPLAKLLDERAGANLTDLDLVDP